MTQPPRRVLITGGAGFVGANLVRRLVTDGHRVTSVVHPATDDWRLRELAGDLDTVKLDLLDDGRVHRLVRDARPEWTFHLAAHGAYSWQRDTERIARTNFLATTTLVEACRDAGCEAFVHAGSSSEYGAQDRAPSEDDLPAPNSAYAVAKVAATMYCQHIARRDGFGAVTLRLYSVYGPFEEPRRLVPTLIARGLRGELPPLVDPRTVRDFVAVADVVDAFIRAASGAASIPGAVYNVGTGSQTSIGEIVAIVRELLEVDAEPEWNSASAREWDTTVWVADSSRIQAELGWRPRIELRAGLQRTADWLTNRPELWERYRVPSSRPARIHT